MTQGQGMRDANPSVLIVDDDPEFSDSVGRLLRSVGLRTQQFSSVADFLKADLPEGPICLVLDVRLPGRSGLELQRDLAAANRQLPIIFITAHGDIPMTVQAMKGGAIEFLTKPFRDQDLIEAVEAGLGRDRARRESGGIHLRARVPELDVVGGGHTPDGDCGRRLEQHPVESQLLAPGRTSHERRGGRDQARLHRDQV